VWSWYSAWVTIILSGFFTDDVQEMTTVAEQNGLTVSQTLQRNNWAVLVLKK
jgi:ribosomal protein L11 methylase PrmA